MKKNILTPFEKCEAIKRTILRTTGEVTAYRSWSADFKLKQIAEIPKIIDGWEKEYGSFKIDPNQMTTRELEKLGFMKWDKKSGIMLIPIWLYPYLTEELNTTSISGSTYTTKKEIDIDNRFGNLAFGVTPCSVITRIKRNILKS